MSKAVTASAVLILAVLSVNVAAFRQPAVNVRRPGQAGEAGPQRGADRAGLPEAHAGQRVQFVIDHEAYDLLPYGDQTRLVVNIPNITLRNALSQMLLPLGMEWVIEKNAVRIMPTAPLVRLTRATSAFRDFGTGVISSDRRRPSTGGSSSGWPSLSRA